MSPCIDTFLYLDGISPAERKANEGAQRIMHCDVRQLARAFERKRYAAFVLGGDIGGTNINFAIAGITKKRDVDLLATLHFKTSEHASLVKPITRALDEEKSRFDISPHWAAIGVAGAISDQNKPIRMTNAKLVIRRRELLAKTQLQKLRILNDFEIIGHAVNVPALQKGGIRAIRSVKGKHTKNAVKAIIGAGTGLGKSILLFDECHMAHVPIKSEGGHAEFPAQSAEELALLHFIKKRRSIKGPVEWEDLVSGRGIAGIYAYLRQKRKHIATVATKAIDSARAGKPALISLYRKKDRLCREAFELFASYYARCARNFALETLCYSGLYIAGGIAAKNSDLFLSRRFVEEFQASDTLAQELRKIPLFLITNYSQSLYGACFAAAL